MEREACRAAMLPMVRRLGCLIMLSACFQSWKLPEGSEIFPRFSPGAQLWRRPGYPNRQCGLGGARAWTFTYDRAAVLLSKLTPAKGSTATRHQSKLVRVYVHTSSRLTKPDHSDVCSMRDRCGPHTTVRYSHNTAILGASIASIGCCTSVVTPRLCAVHWESLSRCAVCNHAAATACGSVALAEAL